MKNNEKDILKYEYNKGEKSIFPCHPFVKSWYFADTEEDEAILANALAVVAEKNGLSNNDLMHLFPYVLRMLRSNIQWSK